MLITNYFENITLYIFNTSFARQTEKTKKYEKNKYEIEKKLF